MFKKLIILLIFVFLLCWIYLEPQESNEDLTCSSKGCHKSIVKFEYLHSPVEDGCDNCHKSNGKIHPETKGNEFTLVDKVPELCYQCHDSKTEKKVIHPPVEDGECLSCHSPHGSSQESLLISDKKENICLSCHDLDIPNMKMKHNPVENGQCIKCHNPHESDNSFLLLEEPPNLCYKCHEDVKKQQELSDIHPPFDEDCFNCHEVHVSSQAFLLKSKIPELCFSCHEDMKDLLSDTALIHQPVLKKKRCINCHSPHSSANSDLLLEKEQNLCLSCHNKKIDIGGHIISNIKEKTRKKFTHPPLVNKGCTVCHNPHTSKNNYLLLKKFPQTKYVNGKVDSFALCFTCHNKNLLILDSTNTATNFRTGNRNFHFLHVDKEKGRNCIFCHDIHGSNNFGLIRKNILFGKWLMPINFEKTKTGGSCAPGCHTKHSYNRLKYPNYTAGIIKGSLIIDQGKTRKIISGLKVNIKSKNGKYNKLIAIRTDQSFYLEGIPPGEYKATINKNKTDMLDLKSDTSEIDFVVRNIPEGDIIDSINFYYHTVEKLAAKKAVPAVKTIVERRKEIEKKVKPNKVKLLSFGSGKRTAKLTKSMKKYLFDIIEYLKTHPKAKVSIIGHTDNRGTLKQNKLLSEKRAKAASQFIISAGINKKRVYVFGRGSLYPIARNDTPQGIKKNNRIEIKILEK